MERGGTFLAKFGPSDTSNDRLVLSGLTVAATAVNKFVVNLSGTSVAAAVGRYILAVDTGSTTTITNTGPVRPFDPEPAGERLVRPSNFSLSEQQDTTGAGGYDLVVTAAPEPASLLLLSMAAAPLALGRRRRAAGVTRAHFLHIQPDARRSR